MPPDPLAEPLAEPDTARSRAGGPERPAAGPARAPDGRPDPGRRATEEGRRHTRQLQELAAVSVMANSLLSVDAVLRVVTDNAREIVGAHLSAMSLTVDGRWTQALSHVSVSDTYAAWRDSDEMPGRPGIHDLVCELNRPIRLSPAELDAHPASRGSGQAAGRHPPLRGWLAAPLLGQDGRNIGVVQLSDKYEGQFTEDDEAILVQLAQMASVALENARLYEEAERQRREAEVVAEVARGIGSSLHLDTVLQCVAEGAKELCRGDLGEIALWNPDLKVMEFPQWLDARSRAYRAVRVEPGKGVGGRVIVTGRPFKTDNYAEDPRITKDYLAAVQEEGVIAQLAVPILADDRVDGLLSVSSRVARRFTDEEEAILVRLAAHATIAIRNARLYTETQRRRREAEELARVAQILTESLDVPTVGQRIVETVLPLFRAHASAVRLLRPDGSLVGIAWAGAAQEHLKPGHTVPAGIGVSGRAVLEGRPVWTRDVLSDPTVALTRDLRSRNVSGGLHGSLAVPLRVQGRAIGALYIADRRVRAFSQSEVALLQAFADQAALALQNASLHDETTRRRHQAETVADVVRSIGAPLDLDTVLKLVVHAAKDLCGSHIAEIALRNPDSKAMEFRERVDTRSPAYRAVRVESGTSVGGQVIATGRPFRTANYAEDPRITKDYLAEVREEGIVAMLAVPVLTDGQVEGLLFVSNRTARPFTDEDEAILTKLADHATIAIQNARLHGEAQRRLRDTETLLAVSRSVSSTLDPTEAMRRVAREMAQALGADMVGAYVPDADGAVLRPLAGYHVPAQLVDAFRRFPFPLRGHCFIEQGWREERPLFIRDPAADPRIDPRILARFPHGSVLFVPMVANASLLGGLFAIWWNLREAPTADELRMVEGIGRQATLALENARLFATSERRRQAAEGLAETADLLLQSLRTREVAQPIVDSLRTLLGAQASALYRADPRSGDMVAIASSGHPPAGAALGIVIPSGAGLVGLAAREGRPVVTPDVLADPRARVPPEIRTWVEESALRAVLVLPLTVRDTVIGALVLRDRQGRVFDGEDTRLAEAFADQAAIALENARLFEEQARLLDETRRQHEEAVALEAVARQLTSSLDRDQVLQRIANIARALSGSDLAFLAPYDPQTDTATIVAAAGARSRALFSTSIARGRGIGGKVLETGEPFTTKDYLHDPRISQDYAEVAREEGTVSQAVVPLRLMGATTGLLCVVNRTARGFTSEDLRVLGRLADQAAIALENSRLYTERMRAERELRARARQQVAIAELGRRALTDPSLSGLMSEFVSAVADTLDVDRCAVLELLPGGEALRLRAGLGWKDGLVGHATVGSGRDSPAGYTLLTDEPVVVEDLSTETRFGQPALLRDHGVVSVLTAIIKGPQGTWGVLSAHTNRHRRFTIDDVRFLRSAANILASAIERGLAEETMRHYTERLRALREIDRAILAARSVRAIASAAVRRLRKLKPGVRASVILLDPEAREARVLAADRSAALTLRTGARLPIEALGDLDEIRQGGGRAVEDIAASSLLPPLLRTLRDDGVRSYIGVPLVTGRRTIGTLNLGADRPGAFSPADLEIAREVAVSLAVAIEQARLSEEVRGGRDRLRALSAQLVDLQEKERREIARELHDEIGQALTALKLTLDMSGRAKPEAAASSLREAQTVVEELMARVRELSLDLRPAMLDDLGLLPALLWHLDRFTARTGVDVTFGHDGLTRRFRPEVETAAYRMVQEALTNVARHSGARRATVRLWTDTDALNLEVADEGVGFDASVVTGATGGLAGMRERALLLGGRLTVESASGTGTQVGASFPLATGSRLERRRRRRSEGEEQA